MMTRIDLYFLIFYGLLFSLSFVVIILIFFEFITCNICWYIMSSELVHYFFLYHRDTSFESLHACFVYSKYFEHDKYNVIKHYLPSFQTLVISNIYTQILCCFVGHSSKLFHLYLSQQLMCIEQVTRAVKLFRFFFLKENDGNTRKP